MFRQKWQSLTTAVVVVVGTNISSGSGTCPQVQNFRIENNLPGAFITFAGGTPVAVPGDKDEVVVIEMTNFGNCLFPAGEGVAAVGENGGAGFGASNLTLSSINDQVLPSPSAFGGATAALVYWDQLVDDRGGDIVWTEIVNPANNQPTLIVQWQNIEALDPVNGNCPCPEVTFQLQVPENLVVTDPNGNPIRIFAQYAYQTIANAGGGQTATIGVQGSGFLFSFDTLDAVMDGDVLSVIAVCDGDANADGLCDPLDAGYVLARLGCSAGTGDQDCDSADQNEDGGVDPLDVGYVLSRFGSCPVGACCTGVVCSEGTQADCEAGGGVFQGSGTDCATTSCGML